jgi:hypothetical protein
MKLRKQRWDGSMVSICTLFQCALPFPPVVAALPRSSRLFRLMRCHSAPPPAELAAARRHRLRSSRHPSPACCVRLQSVHEPGQLHAHASNGRPDGNNSRTHVARRCRQVRRSRGARGANTCPVPACRARRACGWPPHPDLMCSPWRWPLGSHALAHNERTMVRTSGDAESDLDALLPAPALLDTRLVLSLLCARRASSHISCLSPSLASRALGMQGGCLYGRHRRSKMRGRMIGWIFGWTLNKKTIL